VADSKVGRVWRITYPDPGRPFTAEDLTELETRKATVSYLREPDEKQDLIRQR
jgi:hypothetical protein